MNQKQTYLPSMNELNWFSSFSLLILFQMSMLTWSAARGVSSTCIRFLSVVSDIQACASRSLPAPHRVLKVFLSRTAQRTPYMTSWRVLRLLLVILLVVLWFLVAWTSSVSQNPELSQALIAAGLTPEGLQFSMCLLDRWDYMMAVGE